MISYGQQWPDHALRALAVQSNGSAYTSGWFPVDDATALVCTVRITAGAGFTVAPVLETTDDSASGAAHPLATLTPHATTGAKPPESVTGFKRYVRLTAANPGADVTWEFRVTKTF